MVEILRHMDLGQCNNSGSAVKIPQALAKPITAAFWFEQKAVAIVLGTFGPKPPEFISKEVLKVLQATSDLKLTGTAADDLKEMQGSNLQEHKVFA